MPRPQPKLRPKQPAGDTPEPGVERRDQTQVADRSARRRGQVQVADGRAQRRRRGLRQADIALGRARAGRQAQVAARRRRRRRPGRRAQRADAGRVEPRARMRGGAAAAAEPSSRARRSRRKFGGKGKFYPGTIQKVNADGTFAILFDDGDKEPSAQPERRARAAGRERRHWLGTARGRGRGPLGRARRGRGRRGQVRRQGQVLPGDDPEGQRRRHVRDRVRRRRQGAERPQPETCASSRAAAAAAAAAGSRGARRDRGGGRRRRRRARRGREGRGQVRGQGEILPGQDRGRQRDGTFSILFDDGDKEPSGQGRGRARWSAATSTPRWEAGRRPR